MRLLLLIAAADALSTVIGGVLGVCTKKISHRMNDLILGFAAGVMLSAAVLGLIEPSVAMGGEHGALVTVAGMLCGVAFLMGVDKLVPHLHTLGTGREEAHRGNDPAMDRALLFVVAVAIHNLPEGAAVGVSFGTGNMADVLSIAGGIAIQNVPEGMAVIAPLVNAGVPRRRAFLLSCMTALVEAVGVVLGYLAVTLVAPLLPFTLAFAGGAMLYVVSDEMIPDSHGDGNEKGATEALVAGFCVMLLLDFYL